MERCFFKYVFVVCLIVTSAVTQGMSGGDGWRKNFVRRIQSDPSNTGANRRQLDVVKISLEISEMSRKERQRLEDIAQEIKQRKKIEFVCQEIDKRKSNRSLLSAQVQHLTPLPRQEPKKLMSYMKETRGAKFIVSRNKNLWHKREISKAVYNFALAGPSSEESEGLSLTDSEDNKMPTRATGDLWQQLCDSAGFNGDISVEPEPEQDLSKENQLLQEKYLLLQQKVALLEQQLKSAPHTKKSLKRSVAVSRNLAQMVPDDESEEENS